MHRVTQNYPHWRRIPCRGSETSQSGWEEELMSFYEWCQDDEVKQQWLNMKSRLQALPLRRETFGFIHNDNHVQNVLWNNGTLTIIDFDVANCHFFLSEVAVMLQGVLFEAAGGLSRPIVNADLIKMAVRDFMGGYEQEHHLDDFWLHQLTTFVSYRRLLLFTVMQEWLSTQEDRKRIFKEMIHNEPVISVI
jgi:Ser/Thr protein kinase RdoA (MazF antagonist)